MVRESKLITVGIISSAYGINGQVSIKPFTDPINNFLIYN